MLLALLLAAGAWWAVRYNNSDRLVENRRWDIHLQKTGAHRGLRAHIREQIGKLRGRHRHPSD